MLTIFKAKFDAIDSNEQSKEFKLPAGVRQAWRLGIIVRLNFGIRVLASVKRGQSVISSTAPTDTVRSEH